jgi:hypothetical protein
MVPMILSSPPNKKDRVKRENEKIGILSMLSGWV